MQSPVSRRALFFAIHPRGRVMSRNLPTSFADSIYLQADKIAPIARRVTSR